MAALARRARRSTNIWPGFVDALATMLMVIMFLLMVFVLAQFFLGEALSGRNQALDKLNNKVGELADLLALERRANDSLRADMAQISQELQMSVVLRDDLKTTVAEIRLRAEDIKRDLADARSTLTANENTLADNRQAMAENEKALADNRQSMAVDAETIEAQVAELADLSNDISALRALRQELEANIAELASKVETSGKALLAEHELSESARAQVALLNQQMAALRGQLAKISAALDASEQSANEQKVEISALGKRLNAALASKVQELSRYRSEFFGRLRDLVAKHKGVRIVGDRFVIQSEVLFAKGAAEMGDAGKAQLDQLALTLLEIAIDIPGEVDWVLRVDGHTDSDPIKTARYPSNWELSTARALSVVKHLVDAGLPANRLVAAGFGEFHPLDKHTDEIAKRRNRRIELKLTQR